MASRNRDRDSRDGLADTVGRGADTVTCSDAASHVYQGRRADYAALLDIHVRHLEALLQRQLPSGMFAQVLNVPGSYQEFTVTCMVGYAMTRALRRGFSR